MVDEANGHEATVRRHAHHPIPVREIVDETADTRTFVFDVPGELTDLYTYRPGQFCTVRVTVDGTEMQRCYSMSSAPATDDHLAFTVKRVPGGMVSNWLLDHVAPGDVLDLMPPAGAFCERDGDAPILAFCGGSGVTPVFSIVKQVLARGSRPIRLLDANRDHDSIIFHHELSQLARAHPERLTVRHHRDDDAGYLTADDITAFVGTDTDADVFICGPTPFMDLVEAGVAAAGIAADRVSIERFVNTEIPAVPAPEPAGATGPADEATTLTITIRRKRHVLTHVPGDTVLEAARRADLNPPYSCQQGNCATCMAMLTEGSVTMRVNDALTPAEVEEGWVLTCQSLPQSQSVSIVYEDL